MAKLTGQTIAASYDQLLIVDDANGISASLQAIEAGDTGGSSSSLKISTSKCEVIPASNSSSLFEVSQADGTVVLSVNTTNKNIGIRTDAPDHPLEISHTDTSNISGGNIADNSAIGLHIDKTGDNDGAGSVIKLTSNSDACQSAIAHIQVDDNDADLAFYTDNSGTLTEAMRIDNGQKIGVGLISPEGTLHVSAANKAATAAGIVIIDSNSDVDDTHGAKGGSISFGGVYHNNGSRTEFAGISGRKSNNTSNEYGGELHFHSRAHGASLSTPMMIDASGQVGIGTYTAGTGPAALLELDQGAADTIIFKCVSSDVDHDANAASGQTDVFFSIEKTQATSGGATLRGYKDADGDGNGALVLVGHMDDSETMDNTTTISSGGIVEIAGYMDAVDGLAADDNLLVIRAGSQANATRFILQGNGAIFLDSTVTQGDYDSYDDAQLIRSYTQNNSGKGYIKDKWDDFVKYNKQTLADLDLLGKHEDGKPSTFFNLQGFVRLHNGAIWQQYTEMQKMKELMYETMVESIGKKKADKKLDSHDIKLLN